MKKLFALVLVFAMALAIAVPAMAAGWDPIKSTETPSTAITFKLLGLETEKNTAVLGGLYEELKATYPLVKGTEVHFMVVVDVPKAADLSAANKLLIKNRLLTLNVACENIIIDTVETWTNGVASGTQVAVDSKKFMTQWGEGCIGNQYKLEFWGHGVKGGVDSTVVAKLGYYNAWSDIEGGLYTFEAMNASGKVAFTATADDAAYTESKTVEGFFTVMDTNGSIVFPVKGGIVNDDSGSRIIFNKSGDYANNYEVTRSTGSDGGYIFRQSATVAWGVSDTTGQYTALKAAFEAILAKLGFSYDGMNAMTSEHFDLYFGTIDEVSEKLVYPAGYVTVTNPSVEPPQTGDATTVVGFVMIAIALIAAAAVTVKKVRA